MKIRLRYFAQLREQSGLEFEDRDTPCLRVDELWEEVAQAHGFTLAPRQLMAAQNDEFCAWDAPLEPGATVVFMPPVAGG